MTLAQALDIVVSRTGHVRYRALCDLSYPDYLHYQALVFRLATPVSLPAGWPLWILIPRVMPAMPGEFVDCGCGQGRA